MAHCHGLPNRLPMQSVKPRPPAICGLYYLESYCLQLQSKRVSGSAEPQVSRPKSASVKIDAQFGFAQPAFERGLPTALEVADEAGTCALAICHSHTCTSLGYFTAQIANAGMIGIGFTNASAVASPPGVRHDCTHLIEYQQYQAKTLANGSWTKKRFAIDGSWSIVQKNGSNVLVLDQNLKTISAPDLKIFLSSNPLSDLNGHNATNGSVLISPLKSNKGAQECVIPANIDLSQYQALIIHCEAYSKLWGGSSL